VGKKRRYRKSSSVFEKGAGLRRRREVPGTEPNQMGGKARCRAEAEKRKRTKARRAGET